VIHELTLLVVISAVLMRLQFMYRIRRRICLQSCVQVALHVGWFVLPCAPARDHRL